MVRSKVEIISDILNAVKENNSCKKTTIIRIANLDWNMAEGFLDPLVEDSFLEKIQNEESRGGENYKLTDKGKYLLKIITKLKESCSVFNED